MLIKTVKNKTKSNTRTLKPHPLLLLAGLFWIVLPSAAAFAFDMIAQRGAPGYLPEHTLESTVFAHGQQPDFIEQDIVLTKDGIPIVLHDIHLETVTDVETQFPNKKRADGRWYAIDFTLNEIKQLRVHERQNKSQIQVFPTRYQGLGHFTIATFEEHITTIMSLNKATGSNIGLYPEIKSPEFHKAEGVDISATLVQLLNQYKLNNHNANIIVQCFDFNEIKRLRTELNLNTKLVQLLAENEWNESSTDYDYLQTEAGLTELSRYVDGVGPWFNQLIEQSEQQWQYTGLTQKLKKTTLFIHPYTFRVDALPKGQTAHSLLSLLNEIPVHGIFTDQVPPVKVWAEQTKND